MKNFLVNKISYLFFAAVLLLTPSMAWADDVFGTVASKAGEIGTGLKEVGYVIAGLGLVAFSVAAIFNKISWKTLAYIMMSTFFLTAMTAIVSWIKAAPGSAASLEPAFGSSSSANSEHSGNVDKNPVKK